MYFDSKGNVNLKDRYNILGVVDCTADKFYGDGSNLTNLPWSADPMTTRGDLVYRDSSNTTARLGIGAAGKVLASDGTDIPIRVKLRTPSFVNMPTVRLMVQGANLADAPLIQASIDPCFSCTSR